MVASPSLFPNQLQYKRRHTAMMKISLFPKTFCWLNKLLPLTFRHLAPIHSYKLEIMPNTWMGHVMQLAHLHQMPNVKMRSLLPCHSTSFLVWCLINQREPYFFLVERNKIRTASKYSTSAVNVRQKKRTTQLLLKGNKVKFSLPTAWRHRDGDRYSATHS